MKVSSPLTASASETYAGARYLRKHGAIWAIPTARYVETMLEKHGMKSAKSVATPAVTRPHKEGDEAGRRAQDSASSGGPESVPPTTTTRHRIHSEVLCRSLAKPTKPGLAASKRLLRYLCCGVSLSVILI